MSYCLINEGKKKTYKYWAIHETTDQSSLILCYGSVDDREIVAGKVSDMKTHEVSTWKSGPMRASASPDPHSEMLRRVRKKFDEGYSTAPSDVEKVIQKELGRRYGARLFGQKGRTESPQESDSAPKQEKSWKPSDDFAWF